MSHSPAVKVDLDGSLGHFGVHVRFETPKTGITAVFGPSGSGKTTILRCIAGLQQVPGRIEVNGECWQDTAAGVMLPPHRRHAGYVFQEASLFPHLSVRDNLLFGARRVPASVTTRASFEDIVKLLGIAHLLERAPATLSGGERQRVAVGRALLSAPRILLMDEPLSALDRMTKEEILPYFERLHDALSVPVLYVSHDISEIERLADTMVLLEAGRVRACGPLAELQRDASLPLISMPDATVVLKAKVVGFDDQFSLTELDVDGGRLIVPGRHGRLGDVRRLRLAASDVSLARTAPNDSTILNCLPVRILSIEAASSEAQANVLLALGRDGNGETIVARITRKSLAALGIVPGLSAFAQIKGVALVAGQSDRLAERDG